MNAATRTQPYFKKPAFYSRILAHLLCALPFASLVWALTQGAAHPDPAEAIMHTTGEWSIRLLLLTLAIHPLFRILHRFNWHFSWIMLLRRPIGLWAFAYICTHFLGFIVVYSELSGAIMLEEIEEHPYLVFGMFAWALLVPLALTSTLAARRRLGKRWTYIHSLIYFAVLFALAHISGTLREEWGSLAAYLAIAAFLLGLRFFNLKNNRPSGKGKEQPAQSAT